MRTEAKGRRSPYQGLIPYDEKDAPFFFGRETERKIIIANLFASPLTLLYGESGVGKSSVLRAGVAHELRQRDDLLVVVFSAWQGEPLGDLKSAVTKAVFAKATFKTEPRAVNGVRPDAFSGAASLSEYLTAWSRKLNCSLMLVLDQFEEYSLYHPQDDAFGIEFPRAVLQSEAPISFLISIREDSLAKLDRFEGRIPSLFDNYLRIEHLNHAAARAAIELPIKKYNQLQAPDKSEVQIEPALVDAVLEQVETGQVTLGETGRGVIKAEAAESQIETPYLQLVMTRLWDEEGRAGSRTLRLATLESLGGAERIVRTHLDEKMSTLTNEKQQVAAKVFHYLVTPSGAKIAHTAADLAAYGKIEKEGVEALVEELAGGEMRILRGVDNAPDQPDDVRYEIFHDVLAAPVLDWRSRYVKAQELAETERVAKEQRQRAEKEAASARRLRWLVAALIAMFLLAAGTTAFAWTQTRRAKRNEELAKKRAEESESLRTQGAFLRIEGLKAQNAAEAEHQRAEDKDRIARENINLAEARLLEAEKARQLADTAQRRAKEEATRAGQLAVLAATREEAAARAEQKQGQLQKATRLQQEALNLAKADARTPDEANNNVEEAIAKYVESAVILEELGEYYAAASTYTTVGETYQKRYKYQESIDAYERAWPLYKRANLILKAAQTLSLLGEYYDRADIKKGDKAYERYNEAQRLYGSLGQTAEQADTLEKMGGTAWYRSSFQVAEKEYLRAFDLYGKLNNRIKQIDVLTDLGAMFIMYAQEEQKGLDYYNRARSLMINTDEKTALLFEIGNQYYGRAETYKYLEDYRKALEYYRPALELLDKAPADPRNYSYYLKAAYAYYKLNDKENSLRNYEQALILREDQLSGIDSALLGEVTEAYLHFGERRKAISTYQRLLLSYQKNRVFNYRTTIPRIDLASQIYTEPEEQRAAIDFLERLVPAFPQQDLVPARIYSIIGRFYLGLGDKEKAVDTFNLALAIYEGIDASRFDPVNKALFNSGIVDVYDGLGDAYTAMGRTEDAAKAYKKAAEIKLTKQASPR